MNCCTQKLFDPGLLDSLLTVEGTKERKAYFVVLEPLCFRNNDVKPYLLHCLKGKSKVCLLKAMVECGFSALTACLC